MGGGGTGGDNGGLATGGGLAGGDSHCSLSPAKAMERPQVPGCSLLLPTYLTAKDAST